MRPVGEKPSQDSFAIFVKHIGHKHKIQNRREAWFTTLNKILITVRQMVNVSKQEEKEDECLKFSIIMSKTNLLHVIVIVIISVVAPIA